MQPTDLIHLPLWGIILLSAGAGIGLCGGIAGLWWFIATKLELAEQERRETEQRKEREKQYEQSSKPRLTYEVIPVPPELVVISQTTNLIPEIGQSVATSQQQAIERLAQQIVSTMEAPW